MLRTGGDPRHRKRDSTSYGCNHPTLSAILRRIFSGLRVAVRRTPDVFQPSISFDA